MTKFLRIFVLIVLSVFLAACSTNATEFGNDQIARLPENWPTGLPVHKAGTKFEVLDAGKEKLLTYRLPYHRQLTTLGEELVQMLTERGFISRDSAGVFSDTIVVRSLYKGSTTVELTLQNKPHDQSETVVSISYRQE